MKNNPKEEFMIENNTSAENEEISNLQVEELNPTFEFKKPQTPAKAKSVLHKHASNKFTNKNNDIKELLAAGMSKIAVHMMDRKRKGSSGHGEESPPEKKRQWCASPITKCKDEAWEPNGVLDIELIEEKKKHRLQPASRGRWVLPALLLGSHPDDLNSAWCTLCRIVAQGKLPHCNAVLQDGVAIWIYCNFCQSLQVFEILKRAFCFSGTVDFISNNKVILTR